MQIANRHAPPTATADHDALQQGGSLADGPTTVFGVGGTIIIEPLLIAEELVPGDVGGVDVMQDDGPVFALDLVGTALEAGCFTRQDVSSGLGSAIDIGPRVGGIVEHGQDPAMAQRTPQQLAVADATPEAGGEEKLMVGKVLDDSESRT